MKTAQDFKSHFDAVTKAALAELLPGEHAAISYQGESSDFMRFNACKVRQIGSVEQAELGIKLFRGTKSYSVKAMLCGRLEEDLERLGQAVGRAREVMGLLPDDPYLVLPEASERSEANYDGKLLPPESIPERVLKPAQGMDFTGVYSQGSICKGVVNSAGARHWFSTETFLVDYSAWLPNGRAIKSSYAGRVWDEKDYASRIEATRQALKDLHKPQVERKPGSYRAFISPDALAEAVVFFSWDGLGEKCIRQGESAYLALREGRESFSPMFSLDQDFTLGVEPAFNDDGELAPQKLSLIKAGKLENTIVSSRSAKQYGVASNGANDWEFVRSAAIGAGTLPASDALKALGTGIYVSNFHYLNWSDPASARITGMTRFSCMWVENGVVVGPIKDMRWDESLYTMLGSKLEAVTKERNLIVDSETYDQRSMGGSLLPGILVSGLTFTL